MSRAPSLRLARLGLHFASALAFAAAFSLAGCGGDDSGAAPPPGEEPELDAGPDSPDAPDTSEAGPDVAEAGDEGDAGPDAVDEDASEGDADASEEPDVSTDGPPDADATEAGDETTAEAGDDAADADGPEGGSECHVPADCDDDAACTADACENGFCRHPWVPPGSPTACVNDAYCVSGQGCVLGPSCSSTLECQALWPDDPCKTNVRCGDFGTCIFDRPDVDQDGFTAAACGGDDCDDDDDTVHPGEVDVCDGADNDCNGLVDDQAGCLDSLQACIAGECRCKPSNTCNGVCVDTANDANNCGSCGHVCHAGPCASGKCKADAVCGSTLCEAYPVTSLLTNYVAACCLPNDQCGALASRNDACLQPFRQGVIDAACPSPSTGLFSARGCCRADNTCGIYSADVFGATSPYGCVSLAELGSPPDGGTPGCTYPADAGGGG